MLDGKQIVVGVGGGIACYKTLDLIRLLRKAGASVRPAPTKSALSFIQPMTFEALSGMPPLTDVMEVTNGRIHHVEEGHGADLVIVAPATANLMARMAHGMADETLLAILLATRAPILLAPAMETNMWQHPATQANFELLKKRGCFAVGPEEGSLASGRTGPGRMAPPEQIFEMAEALLAPKDWAGRSVLLTAGPTCEDIDPVRFLTNRSSGKMGVALARALAQRGADVNLIHGPLSVSIPTLSNIRPIAVRTAKQMHDEVMNRIQDVDTAILCAAVADFAPKTKSEEKIKKTGEALNLELFATDDILADIGRLQTRPLLIGFAAESSHLEGNARQKLKSKHCDMICANDISQSGCGFEADTNQFLILRNDQDPVELPNQSKEQAAHQILDFILKIS